MLKQFLREEQGQTTVEYLLIIAVIVVVIMALGNKMKTGIDALTTQIFGNITKAVNKLMSAGMGG